MKICIDERTYEGSGTEIMEQLRQQTFDPTEYPDTESYIHPCRLFKIILSYFGGGVKAK